jgi:hypothetical protein
MELPFQGLGLVPSQRKAKVVEAAVTWNYVTVLNIVFLGLAGAERALSRSRALVCGRQLTLAG